MSARLICCKSKFDHITPVLIDLHWLPVSQRIVYKILVNTFKALNGQSPQYLSQFVVNYKPTRTLRSSSNMLLTENRIKTKYGMRAFSNNSSVLWNKLPKH